METDKDTRTKGIKKYREIWSAEMKRCKDRETDIVTARQKKMNLEGV